MMVRYIPPPTTSIAALLWIDPPIRSSMRRQTLKRVGKIFLDFIETQSHHSLPFLLQLEVKHYRERRPRKWQCPPPANGAKVRTSQERGLKIPVCLPVLWHNRPFSFVCEKRGIQLQYQCHIVYRLRGCCGGPSFMHLSLTRSPFSTSALRDIHDQIISAELPANGTTIEPDTFIQTYGIKIPIQACSLPVLLTKRFI